MSNPKVQAGNSLPSPILAMPKKTKKAVKKPVSLASRGTASANFLAKA